MNRFNWTVVGFIVMFAVGMATNEPIIIAGWVIATIAELIEFDLYQKQQHQPESVTTTHYKWTLCYREDGKIRAEGYAPAGKVTLGQEFTICVNGQDIEMVVLGLSYGSYLVPSGQERWEAQDLESYRRETNLV